MATLMNASLLGVGVEHSATSAEFLAAPCKSFIGLSVCCLPPRCPSRRATDSGLTVEGVGGTMGPVCVSRPQGRLF
jgi:hypothetical protein